MTIFWGKPISGENYQINVLTLSCEAFSQHKKCFIFSVGFSSKKNAAEHIFKNKLRTIIVHDNLNGRRKQFYSKLKLNENLNKSEFQHIFY